MRIGLLIEGLGLCVLVAGLWMAWPPLGMMALGGALVVVGLAIGGTR